MKERLTGKESQKLFDLGIPIENASIFRTDCPARVVGYIDEHLFTLNNLIELIPKSIEHFDSIYNFRMEYSHADKEWYVGHYISGICAQNDFEWNGFHAPELVDALYRLIVWCKEWKVREHE